MGDCGFRDPVEHESMMTRIQYRILGSVLLMFAAGVTSGALIAWPAAKRAATAKRPSMERACDFMKHKLESRLQLSPGQIEKISPRMEQTARELDAVHERSMVEIEEIFNRSSADISKELTPGQIPLLREMERERREFFSHRHPPGGSTYHSNDQPSSSDKTNTLIYGGK